MKYRLFRFALNFLLIILIILAAIVIYPKPLLDNGQSTRNQPAKVVIFNSLGERISLNGAEITVDISKFAGNASSLSLWHDFGSAQSGTQDIYLALETVENNDRHFRQLDCFGGQVAHDSGDPTESVNFELVNAEETFATLNDEYDFFKEQRSAGQESDSSWSGDFSRGRIAGTAEKVYVTCNLPFGGEELDEIDFENLVGFPPVIYSELTQLSLKPELIREMKGANGTEIAYVNSDVTRDGLGTFAWKPAGNLSFQIDYPSNWSWNEESVVIRNYLRADLLDSRTFVAGALIGLSASLFATRLLLAIDKVDSKLLRIFRRKLKILKKKITKRS